MADPGAVLRTNNERIVEFLITLKAQRNELQLLIEKQEQEKKKLQHEIERINYKLGLMAKSLAQRLAARDKYDQTIREAEENYQRIVECSGILLNSVQKEYGVLSEAIDKRVGTDAEDFKAFDNIEINFQNLNDYRIIEPSSSKYNRQRIMVKPVATVDSSTQFEDIKGESGGEDAESVSSSQTEEEMSQTLPPLQPRTQDRPSILRKSSESFAYRQPPSRSDRCCPQNKLCAKVQMLLGAGRRVRSRDPPIRQKSTDIIPEKEELKNTQSDPPRSNRKAEHLHAGQDHFQISNSDHSKKPNTSNLTQSPVQLRDIDDEGDLLEVAPDVSFFATQDRISFHAESESEQQKEEIEKTTTIKIKDASVSEDSPPDARSRAKRDSLGSR